MARIARLAIVFALVVLTANAGTMRTTPATPAPKKSNCCAQHKAEDPCSHRSAPQEQQQCCVSCPLCVAILINSGVNLSFPPAGDEFFPDFTANAPSRSDRPPVPPPRA